MTTSNVTLGEFLWEVNVNLVGITEYGISMADIMSGQAAPPPQGARFDASFEGTITGPKVKGTAKGVDYLNMRADGRADLHIHGEITTDDNQKIALFADGVATPEGDSGVLQLRENATATTASAAYSWLNARQLWGIGTVNPAEGVVNLKVYLA